MKNNLFPEQQKRRPYDAEIGKNSEEESKGKKPQKETTVKNEEEKENKNKKPQMNQTVTKPVGKESTNRIPQNKPAVKIETDPKNKIPLRKTITRNQIF